MEQLLRRYITLLRYKLFWSKQLDVRLQEQERKQQLEEMFEPMPIFDVDEVRGTQLARQRRMFQLHTEATAFDLRIVQYRLMTLEQEQHQHVDLIRGMIADNAEELEQLRTRLQQLRRNVQIRQFWMRYA